MWLGPGQAIADDTGNRAWGLRPAERRQLLRVIGRVGHSDFVTAGNEETELAPGEIAAGVCSGVEHDLVLAIEELMGEGADRNPGLNCAVSWDIKAARHPGQSPRRAVAGQAAPGEPIPQPPYATRRGTPQVAVRHDPVWPFHEPRKAAIACAWDSPFQEAPATFSPRA
jgi:hypothetical protein